MDTFLSQKDVFEFDLRGYSVFREFISASLVAKLNQIIDDNHQAKKPFKFDFATLSPLFLDLVSDRRILEVCHEWIDPGFRFEESFGVQTYPGDSQKPDLHAEPYASQGFFQYHWHKNRPFSTCLLFALFLEEQNGREGGLVFVPGSHKSNTGISGRTVHSQLLGGNNLSADWVVQPRFSAGDLLVFTEATTHGTQTWINPSRRRRVLYLKYCLGNMSWLEPNNPEILKLRSLARNEQERLLFRPPYVTSVIAGEGYQPRSPTYLKTT